MRRRHRKYRKGHAKCGGVGRFRNGQIRRGNTDGGADIGRLISDMDEVATKMQSIAPQVERLSGGIQSQRFDLSKIGDSISGLGDGLKQASALLKEVAATRVQLRDSVEKLTSEMSLFDTDSKGEQ